MGHKRFNSPDEALAFIAGVEYVNDPTLTAYVSDGDPCCVILEDEDVEDDPSGTFYDSIVGTVPS